VGRARKVHEVRGELRRHEVGRLYVRGFTQAEIASQMGVTQPVIHHELKALGLEWVKSAAMDFQARQAEELARLDMVEAEAWKEWERSKARSACTTTNEFRSKGKKDRGEDGGRKGKPNPKAEDPDELVLRNVATATTVKDQLGDPRYLAQVTECVRLRMKLLGFLDEKVVQVLLQSKQGLLQPRFDWSALYGPPESKPSDALEEKISRAGQDREPLALPPAQGEGG